VISTPPLRSHNRYACLSVDKIEDPSTDKPDCVKDVQTPSSPTNPRRCEHVRRTRWERRLPRKYVISSDSSNSLEIDIEIETTDTNAKRRTKALVDCGATGLFIDSEYARTNNVTTRSLTRPIPVFNVDGTPNEAGMIREVADVVLRHKDHSERAQFAVTQLGKHSTILGFTWLREHNPEVDWRTKEIRMSRCPARCATCRSDLKLERQTIAQISACRVGAFPVTIEDVDDDDEDDSGYAHEGVTGSEGEVTMFGSRFGIGTPVQTRPRPFRRRADFPDLLGMGDDPSTDFADIEQEDRIFTAHILPEDQHHFIRATGTVSQRLAEAFSRNSGETSFRDSVPASLHDFEDIFNKESFDSLPQRRRWDHAIELEREPAPGFRKVYPMSVHEQAELDAFLEEALSTGKVRPSKSPIGAPVFFVKKKDGKLRFVQDYRALNAITRKNRYPLPLIDDLIHRLKGARYFTKLDVRWGYNNVRIKEGDEWKAAFRTNRGLFEPLVMYFGLTNSPATFQTMMNDIFHDLIMEGVVCIYLDDILIFTDTLEEHRRISRLVMERLREHKLYLRHDKCEFEKTRIEYLGVIISHNHVEMDPVKIAGVAEWPAPRSKKEVQSFIGFANFYRRFIQDFSHHARALFDLTRKDAPFTWGVREEDAFAKIKELVTSAPVLVLPDSDRPYRVEADGSGVATGAVLSQLSAEDDRWHPVAFLSKSLSAVERNYEIHDTEMLAIIRALEEWRHYLEGARLPVEIWTDHKNLEYFRSAQKLNRRQARWSLYLSRFDFTLHHKPGRCMGKPDALSRRADHGSGRGDNDNMTLLDPALFRICALSGLDIVGGEREILREIRRSLRDNDLEESVAKAARELRKDRARGTVRSAEWSEMDGLLVFRGKIYVPNDRDLRRRIVAQHHDSTIGGHPGRWKTLELVSRNYWWPQMSRYVGIYVRTCDPCNRTKTHRKRPIGELHPVETPPGRWEKISVDFIVELPHAHGYDAVMNVVDYATKRAHFIPTHTTVSAEGAAWLYFREIWKHHGLPNCVLSDRGSQFVAAFTRELYRLLRIELAPSTAFHPQTDGQTERVNQELEQFLRIFINERQDDWDELLPLGEFAYNNHVHSSTQQTPFMTDTGRHPRMGFEPREIRSHLEPANEFRDRMENGLTEAKAALIKAKDEYSHYYNRRRSPAPELKPGDMVWVEADDIATTRPSAKLGHRRLGPWPVEACVGRGAYRIGLPPSMRRLHPVFPIVKLTLAEPDPIPGRHPVPPPPPVLVGSEEEYEVEQVLDSRVRWRRLEYLVKWRGYDVGHNSWIPHYNVHAPDLTTAFHQQHPGAPRQINFASFDAIPFSKADISPWWRSTRRGAVP
jgi:RNase H-like domain found in reverse transcriptase/Reverse transcriptase (RNA-dependent DNA polymerase)/Integrase zinc binding domain/Chromo (CHRromatin Organisation MOdifier) domain